LRAPAGSEREEWGGGSGPAAGLVGSKRRWADGKGKRKRGGGGLLGWAERRGRERVWEVFFNLFKLTFQTFEIELFSKHSKIFKTFLKSFKTSHKQIIKPCIQNMMHKHLLLLNY
jgi:hypothetical protein